MTGFSSAVERGWLWASAQSIRARCILVGLCLLLFLPWFASFPLTDRDEALFAQSSRQMVETGDISSYQTCRKVPPDLMALIDEIAVHARAAIGAVRQREGRPVMRQIDHVLLLAAAGRTVLPGEDATLAYPENAAHLADREAGLLRLDEAEGHLLPSFAKKAAA